MGSAIQPNLKTVQGELENVLQKLNINSKTVFSGRTDKNVHASKQVVSFKIPSFWNDKNKLLHTLDKMLPKEISILNVRFVPDDFHARFSAKKREYRYIISLDKPNTFSSNYFHYEEKLNIEKMKKIAKLFIGTHDFKSFSKMGSEPNSTTRTIYKIDIYQYKKMIIIKFQANAYLRSQIRMIVDCLLKASKDKLFESQIKEQIENINIHSTTLAPPCGLYLSRIIY
jgi:tRNA pseudouridine38-40 synthase